MLKVCYSLCRKCPHARVLKAWSQREHYWEVLRLGLNGRSLGHLLLKRTERLGFFLLSLLSDHEVGGLVLLSAPCHNPKQGG